MVKRSEVGKSFKWETKDGKNGLYTCVGGNTNDPRLIAGGFNVIYEVNEKSGGPPELEAM